jgi:predicted nucleotidyltransferase
MDLGSLLSSPKIREFCQKHYIRQLAFFGSVMREDFGPAHNIDVWE